MIGSIFKRAGYALCQAALEVLYPLLCYYCERQLSGSDLFICPECRQQIAVFNGELDKALAGRSFDRIYILYEYGPVIRELIHLLKYKHYLGLCTLFAREVQDLFPGIKQTNYTAILPVPLHRIRKRERGYNQSEEIARAIGLQFNISLKNERLLRLRNTASQTRKSRTQREENMKNAFTCSGSLYAENILLVDDVVTTGSTIESCIMTLKAAGAFRVDVLAIAHPREII